MHSGKTGCSIALLFRRLHYETGGISDTACLHFFPVNNPIFLLVDLSQFYGLVFVLSYIRKLRSRFHHF